MQNHHHDSNSSMGLDQNDDDEHTLKRKPDDDSLENVSDEQTSKTSPPIQTNNLSSSSAANLKSMASLKNTKNEKSSLMSAYRLQPIRTGNKRDEQQDNSSTNELHLSPPPPSSASIQTPVPTPTPILTPILTPTLTPTPTPTPTIPKEDSETHTNHRRISPAKLHLAIPPNKEIPLEPIADYDQLDVRLKSYPSLFNDHAESIRLPFPQFAFEHIKTSTTASNVLVVLNPKAHLKHSSLGLNNPSLSSVNSTKHETSVDTNLSNNITLTSLSTTSTITTTTTILTTANNNDDDLSNTRIPLDERIRLLDKHMYELNHGQQKSTASSSSSSSSSSLSPATLIEQQNQKTMLTSATTIPSVATVNNNATVKSVNELVSTLSATTSSSATLVQCIQAARAAALSAQPSQSISPSKPSPTISTTSPFHFPVTSVSSLNLNRTLPTTSPSSVHLSSVLKPPPPPPPPPPFANLQRLSDPSSNSILNTFHAAIAQTQIATKYNTIPFPTAIHPPPPPVPPSLISPSLTLSSPQTSTTPSNHNLISSLSCPPPPSSPSLSNRSTPANLLSPPISNIQSVSSFTDSSSTTSPSTSSAKILERLGPSAKFKRKPIPPPLAVVTTPTTPTNMKDSPILPSPESTTPTNITVNAHHSPVPSSSPVLQHQLSTSSSPGLKSILKQRSLSNPSPTSSLSPTNERKSSTNYVSPLASSETRSTSQVTSTTNRSTSIDSTTKRTPPTTPTIATEKKKPVNQHDNSVFTNDIDERQALAAATTTTTDDKMSTWRTPPTKQTLSNEQNNIKKTSLDKIPKKSTTTSKPSVTAEPVKSAAKVTKITKPTPMTSLGTKVPQLTLERIDPKSIKTSSESSNKSSSTTTTKAIKLKRANVIQSDSDSEKKTSSTTTSTDVQKTKKSLLNNEITKLKTKPKTSTTNAIRKPSVTDTHSSDESDNDEKKTEQTTTTTTSDHDQASSDSDGKTKKEPIKKRTKTMNKNKIKSTQNSNSWRELRQDTSMYDRIKKRARNEQTRNSSLSTSEDHLSDENSDEDDDDNNEDDDEEDNHKSNRSNNITSRRPNVMSDSSDSEIEIRSKTKTKKPTVFDNNIFDAEESDDNSKSNNRKNKIPQMQTQTQTQPQPQPQPQTKKPILKTNNEQTKKEKTSKIVEEQSATKKKITILKPSEKKKSTVNTTKPLTKTTKTTTSAQKRPSTDESNESTKKIKLDEEKSKTITTSTTTIEEQNPPTPPPPVQIESTISTSDKPSIVITSPPNEPVSVETNPPVTPTKFGIVFTSHHRHSTTTPIASIRKQSTETSTSHETSKNDDEEMDDDHRSVSIPNDKTTNKDEQTPSNANTLKPPTATAQSALSDDETLNPETMQLSDLIGGSRREEPTKKSAPSRSTVKTTGKGKRTSKHETLANKRQQTKTNAKGVQPTVSTEKQPVPPVKPTESTVVVPVEQPSIIATTAKRLSTAESSTTASSINEKEAKRLRKSTDNLPVQTQVKLEPIENISQWSTNTKIKEECMEPILSTEIHKHEISLPLPSTPVPDQSQITSMETEQIPPSSSIINSTHSPSTTSTETDNAIKALCPSIQIPQQTISKSSNQEKSSPIIAPISKETLPIVEHQPTAISTTSILPPHVSIKSSLTSATFSMLLEKISLSLFYFCFFSLDENVEETLSAVNSLLMLNNNPPNLAGDHPVMKGTARIAPTISKPVYSFVASLPSPTDQQTRQPPITTPTTTATVTTPSTQQNDLITMVSNIVSSNNLNTDKPSVTTTAATTTITTTTTTTTTTSATGTASTRSHIEEVIDDVAKGISTTATTAIVTESTTSMVDTNSLISSSVGVTSTTTSAPSKTTPIPNILRDVMKTPCLTSSTTVTTSTTTTSVAATTASETLNLFDSHYRSTSPLKTIISTSTATSTTAPTSVTSVAPVIVRPTVSKSSSSSSHKHSSTSKTDTPPPSRSPIPHPFPHMLTSDGNLFAAAAHHSNFPFALFAQLPSNASNSAGTPPSNLLASSLVSNSPPLATRISSGNNSSSSTSSHMINSAFLNTIMTGQQNPSLPSNTSQHTHEKASRRDSVTKVPGTSSSSLSNRSTSIQQTVPVPIALTIPSSSSSSSSSSSISNATNNNLINQQQSSPLLSSLDAATAAAVAMRQQASPLQQYLGADPVAPYRNVFADAAELYGTPPGLYPPQNIAYAAAAQQMLNVMSITGNHHPSAAAFADLYSNSDSYFRLNPPTNELSRDPYNVQWQGNLILKSDQAYVKTQLVAGSPQIARASMNYWNSDSSSSTSSNLQTPSTHNLRISQRMRLEQAQLEGVQKRMQMDNDHCILIAEPYGSTPDEIRLQQNNLKNGVIRYFDEKKAAGIVNVLLPGASQPAYVVHIFPPCQFASEILQKRAPDTYRCVVQNKIEQIYLLIVITSTVQ
ncbi:hypothetical protein I4U23_006614 [Adineta vaga]|nr:hypothetical protein I4U23_006614 [Adineta vaga]